MQHLQDVVTNMQKLQNNTDFGNRHEKYSTKVTFLHETIFQVLKCYMKNHIQKFVNKELILSMKTDCITEVEVCI